MVVNLAADCGDCSLHPTAAGLVLDLGDFVSLGGSAGLHRGGSHSGRRVVAEFVSGVSATKKDSGAGAGDSG